MAAPFSMRSFTGYIFTSFYNVIFWLLSHFVLLVCISLLNAFELKKYVVLIA